MCNEEARSFRQRGDVTVVPSSSGESDGEQGSRTKAWTIRERRIQTDLFFRHRLDIPLILLEILDSSHTVDVRREEGTEFSIRAVVRIQRGRRERESDWLNRSIIDLVIQSPLSFSSLPATMDISIVSSPSSLTLLPYRARTYYLTLPYLTLPYHNSYLMHLLGSRS